jgi:hypothetical protein
MSDQLRLVDRSRFITAQFCPRKRFLEYEWDGTGLSRVKQAIPLAIGICVHAGLAELLQGVAVDDAVKEALIEYDSEVKRRGLEMDPKEDAAYVYNESRALIEALIRVYAIVALPQLFLSYDVLEVEREDLWESFAPGIGWMSRADGLLRERETGDLYVLSFKTAAQWDSRTDRQNTHDVQGLSEVAAIENRLAEWWKIVRAPGDMLHTLAPSGSLPETNLTYGSWLRDLDAPPRILGVKMVYLLKGRREEYPDDSGQWVTSSPLIRGWYREGITGTEFAWRYKWFGPDTYPDSGKLCGHTLGKGWKRFNVWEHPGGVKAWIDLLASGTVQPDAGDPLATIVYEPQPYYRNQQDLEDWHQQAAAQEGNIATCAFSVAIETPSILRQVLNSNFPQHRHSCDYPSKCQFQEICFGDQTMLTNPLASGLYERRVPNHIHEKLRSRRQEIK